MSVRSVKILCRSRRPTKKKSNRQKPKKMGKNTMWLYVSSAAALNSCYLYRSLGLSFHWTHKHFVCLNLCCRFLFAFFRFFFFPHTFFSSAFHSILEFLTFCFIPFSSSFLVLRRFCLRFRWETIRLKCGPALRFILCDAIFSAPFRLYSKPLHASTNECLRVQHKSWGYRKYSDCVWLWQALNRRNINE